MAPAVREVEEQLRAASATAPTLALAVPAYNQGAYLKETLASALAQSVPFDEIVVSNNHSSDETAAVLAEYSDRVTVTSPASHLPMAPHWNFVVRQVRSEWVAVVSSDDVLRPNFSEVLRRAASRDPAAVYVRAAWDVIDGESRHVRRHYLMSLPPVTRPPHTLLEQLAGPKAGLHSSAFKVDAWRASTGFPEECEFAADWGLWVRLAPLGSFIYDPVVVSAYRTGHQNQLQPERMPQYLRDHARFATVLIPEAAEAMGIPNHPKIRQAAERRLVDCVRAVATGAYPMNADAAASILEEWAGRIDRADVIVALREGSKLPREPALERLRRLVAVIARPAYTRWRG